MNLVTILYVTDCEKIYKCLEKALLVTNDNPRFIKLDNVQQLMNFLALMPFVSDSYKGYNFDTC